MINKVIKSAVVILLNLNLGNHALAQPCDRYVIAGDTSCLLGYVFASMYPNDFAGDVSLLDVFPWDRCPPDHTCVILYGTDSISVAAKIIAFESGKRSFTLYSPYGSKKIEQVYLGSTLLESKHYNHLSGCLSYFKQNVNEGFVEKWYHPNGMIKEYKNVNYEARFFLDGNLCSQKYYQNGALVAAIYKGKKGNRLLGLERKDDGEFLVIDYSKKRNKKSVHVKNLSKKMLGRLDSRLEAELAVEK